MSAKERYSATIFKKKDGTYGIEIHTGKPIHPEGTDIIDVLYPKDDETLEDFRDRAVRFVNEVCP